MYKLTITIAILFVAAGIGHSTNSIISANNDFAIRFYRKLCRESGNIFFSPISIYVTMAMILRGTEGKTAKEMRKALGFELAYVPEEEIHENLGLILSELNQKHGAHVISIANFLFLHKEFQLTTKYKNDLKVFYNAIALELDFKNQTQKAVDDINEWIRVQTRDRIHKVFDSLEDSTVVVLANAIYFKGSWLHKFNSAYTRQWRFLNRGLESHSKEIPMMFVKNSFKFAENEDFKVLELPYEGENVVMLLLLSKMNRGLPNLERSLNMDFLMSLIKQMHKIEVEVSLPKFQINYSKNLKETLKNLGLHRIFSNKGNFKRMVYASEGLAVSEITHNAALEVNEEGSEAAAVSVAVLQSRCLKILPEFFADHPFLFVIYHKKSNTILFIGRVEEL